MIKLYINSKIIDMYKVKISDNQYFLKNEILSSRIYIKDNSREKIFLFFFA